MSAIATFNSNAGPDLKPMEFLTFTLGAEEYGIDIATVQELRRYDAVTTLASAPADLKGVVNLRGCIVPIIDLRIRFGLPTPVYDQFTVVIIVNVGASLAGIVVDSVCDVTALSARQIQPRPHFCATVDAGVLIGLGTPADRVLVLVDIEALLGYESARTASVPAVFH